MTTPLPQPLRGARPLHSRVLAVLSAMFSMALVLLAPNSARAQTTTLSMNKYLVDQIATPLPTNPTSNQIPPFANKPNPFKSPAVYTYVISIDGPGGQTISVADSFPNFTLAAGGCTWYTNGVAQTPTITPPFSGLTFGAGTLSNITIYCPGSFNTTGTTTNSATASGGVGVGSTTATVSSTVIPTPPTFDLGVVKTASAPSVANGGTVNYTITVTNLSNPPVPVPLANAVNLLDQLTNSSSLEFDVAWTAPVCTPTPSTGTCFTGGSAGNQTLPPGTAANIFSTTGLNTSGTMGPGESMTITYSVTFDTWDPCAPTPPSLNNSAYLRNGGGVANFADLVVGNNTSNLPVSISGLPTTCPPPPISITKTRLTNPAQWGQGVSYQITVTNTSTNTVKFGWVDQIKSNGAATFDATVSPSSPTCLPNCAITNLTWVGSAPMTLLKSIPPGSLIETLAPGASFNLKYEVTYDKPSCSFGPVKITNIFGAKGKQYNGSTLVSNFRYDTSETAVMPPLPACKFKVFKSLSPSTVTPLTFGAPYGTYTIIWKNFSPFPIRLGSVWDVMSLDSSAYASVNVHSAPTPSCVAFSGSVSPIPSPAANVLVSYATPISQGVRLVFGQNLTFGPMAGLKCTYKAIADIPSPQDPKCQAVGQPKLLNYALADPDPAYNPNLPPKVGSPIVPKRLPLCRNILISKVPVPSVVLPGDPVKWTVTITNVGPPGPLSGPIGGFVLNDALPAPLTLLTTGTGVSAPSCAPTTACTVAWPNITVSPNAIPVGGSITVTFWSTSPTTVPSPKTNVVNANPAGPGFYWHDGVTPPSGQGQINTGRPYAVKSFNPPSINQNGTSTLTFTIYNLSYKPAVSPLDFKDLLPSGLAYSNPATTCTGGTAGLAVVSNQYEISLTNASFTAGQASCTVTVQVTGRVCQSYVNVPTDASSPSQKVDVTQLSATLTITGCSTGPAALPTLTKSYASNPVGTTLTFTLTNPAPNGAVSGLGFVDAMPAGTATLVSNTCGGTVTGGTSVTLTGGAMPATNAASPTTCTIVMSIAPPNSNVQCGSFVNNASNVTSTTVDASGASATLVVNCPGKLLEIVKTTPPGVGGTFVFTVVCGAVTLTATLTIPGTTTWNAAPPSGVTSCTVTEATPAVGTWQTPTFSVTSPGNTATITSTGSTATVNLAPSGTTSLGVFNTPGTPPTGSKTVSIEKIVRALGTTQTLPTPSGTYSFTLVCGGTSYPVSLVAPTPGIWTSPALPATTTSCTLTEDLATRPATVPWAGSPLFYVGSPSGTPLASTGATATVPLNATGSTAVIVVNQRI